MFKSLILGKNLTGLFLVKQHQLIYVFSFFVHVANIRQRGIAGGCLPRDYRTTDAGRTVKRSRFNADYIYAYAYLSRSSPIRRATVLTISRVILRTVA